MTTFLEWREYGENLNRFASTREKADSPMDRIIVQVKNGVQKVIAGDFGKTLIVTVGPTDQPDGMVMVSSRLFLGTLKTLKGKGEAEVRITTRGAVITTNFGSEIEMDAITSPTKFLEPKPFSPDGWTAKFPAGFLPAAARYLAITADYSPFNQVLAETHGHDMYFRTSEDHIMSKVGPIHVDVPRTISFPDHVFPALRGLEDAGGIYIPVRNDTQVHQAQFGAGKYRVVCVIYPKYPTFPHVAEQGYTATVRADKKVLIDTFKSLAGRHQYSRVVMEASDGTFVIRSGDNGVARLSVDCEGTGSLPVNAAFIAKVLQVVDGKTATIQFADAPSHVRIVGDNNGWPILVSPMK